MQERQVQFLTLDAILDEQQTFSVLSLPLSFNIKDIENQKLEQPQINDDYSDLFEEEDDSVSISLTKKSQTTKTVSKIDMIRSMSVIVKDESHKNFVLKETVIDQKLFTKNVTFMNIANVSKPFEVTNKLVGLPTSIYATSSKFLAVGTSQSSVVLFEMGVKDYKLMETVNKNKYGSTTSIAISKDNTFMVCGYQNGYLTIWDLSTFSLTKTIQSQMNNQSILKLEFIKGNQFISSDLQGNVVLHNIKKYVWTSIESKQLITKSSLSMYYDIKTIKLTNNKYVVALISYSSLTLICVDPIQQIHKFERPADSPSSSVPIGDIGIFRNGELDQNYVIISLGSKLFIYLYNTLSRTEPFQLVSAYQHSLNIISLQILSSSSLILLDSAGAYRIINLISYLNNIPNFIKSQGILKNNILTGRCAFQDIKYKNTANTVCKTIDHFNEIFFITQGGMFRCRFHKWTEMIYYLLENKQFLQALKCAIEIFNGRFDAFSQKVVISPKTMVLFNDMITYYLNVRLKQIRTLSNEVIRQIVSTSIQYCIEIRSFEHLFSKVFTIVAYNFHLQKIFIQSLQIFIKSHLIKRIPNFVVLQKIINHYTEEDSSVVDTLILSLDPFSIDYFATLDVCVTHHLYSSLIYISEINNDFVSPANKIIEACQVIRDKGGSTEIIEEYTSLIYLQMIKLLEGKTIAGTPLSQKGTKLGIATLSLWFVIEENMRNLVSFNGVLYFEILQKLMSNEEVLESLEDSLGQSERGYDKLLIELRGLAVGYKEYEEALVNIILKVDQISSVKKDMVEYCLKNMGTNVNKETLQKFVSKNSQTIQQIMDKDGTTALRLPKQLKALVLLNNKKQKEALNLYEQLPSEQLSTLFANLNDQLAKSYLERLINLDPDSTGQYIYQNFYHEQIADLVAKLPEKCSTYLFIRRLKRKDEASKLIKFKKETELFYLQSLCKYKLESRVLYELKSQDYPKDHISQSLKLVKKYKLKECQAELLPPSESFSIYKEVYILRFASELQKLFSYKYSSANDYERVVKSIFKMLSQQQQTGKELQFFGYVVNQLNLPGKNRNYKTIGNHIQEIADKKAMKDNNFIKIIKWMVQNFLNICAKTSKKEQLKQFLQDHIAIFQLKFMASTLTSTVSKLGLNISIYSTISSIIHNDDVSKFDKILQLKGTTFSCKPICRSCSLFLTEGLTSSIVFQCGHCFHIQCALNYQNCQICNENMFTRSSQRRQTVLLEQSRYRNKSVIKQLQINPMDSYVAFDDIKKKDSEEEDWSLPVVRGE